jgi:hypothetical protein
MKELSNAKPLRKGNFRTSGTGTLGHKETGSSESRTLPLITLIALIYTNQAIF